MTYLSNIRNIQVAQQRQTSQSQRVDEMLPSTSWIAGQFLVDGTGLVVKDISFPVEFTNEPLFFYGSRLDENQHVPLDSLPTVNAVVISMDKVVKTGGGTTFKGATIGVTTTGEDDQKLWINWHFVGVALVNPVNTGNTTDHMI